jgi:hypothetical protein
VKVDPNYNLNRQKKDCLQLAHLKFTLACIHSLEIFLLSSKKLRVSDTT